MKKLFTAGLVLATYALMLTTNSGLEPLAPIEALASGICVPQARSICVYENTYMPDYIWQPGGDGLGTR